jgi:hypothetical protein
MAARESNQRHAPPRLILRMFERQARFQNWQRASKASTGKCQG